MFMLELSATFLRGVYLNSATCGHPPQKASQPMRSPKALGMFLLNLSWRGGL